MVLVSVTSFAFAENGNDYILYNQDGVKVMYRRAGKMNPDRDRAQPFRSGGADNKERLDAIMIYNQSTYGKPEPVAFITAQQGIGSLY